MSTKREIAFKVAIEDQQLVFAEVYAPNLPDTDNDFMVAEDIQKMAYRFMKTKSLTQIDVQHNNEQVEGACVVESFIARKGDELFIEGAWVVGVYIGDLAVWEQVKKGEINGFSMEALVSRTAATLEIEVPPVIRGETSKAEDSHYHEFFVTYDPDGNFLGGVTSKSGDGHIHTITRGTITDDSNEHNHKFSFVEGLLVGQD